MIDNVAHVQGRLSECAVAVTKCLAFGLPLAGSYGREYILDLLATMAGGYDDHVDSGPAGPVSVRDCVRAMAGVFDFCVEEMKRRGNATCVDIILMCGVHEEGLRKSAHEALREALTLDSCARIEELIESSLQDLYQEKH
ncbi:hypothetical protein [Kitasatospora cineracea]|uniref:hypothetical protein n=1 Tax=Kitasatospora cineracea TaxID=88074 RepID=UPI000F49F09E|nr:hypothetical protein [Kitasatospora cineracea]